MKELEELKALYEEYFRNAEKARKRASLFGGVFGLGEDPRRHPCHEDFFETLGEWTEQLESVNPEPEIVREVVKWILEAPLEHGSKDTFWILYVAHGHIKSLIPLLNDQDRKAFAQWYDEKIPKRDRLPVQAEVYKLLNPEAAKHRKKLFWRK